MTEEERKAMILAKLDALEADVNSVLEGRDKALTEAAALRSENVQLRLTVERFVRIASEESDAFLTMRRLEFEVAEAEKTLDWL